MSLTSDYRYDLHVEGADAETLESFKTALNKTPFKGFLEQDPDEPDLFTTEVWGSQGGMYEENVQEYLHDLAMDFPQLTLTLTAMDMFDSGTGYELTLKGDMFQRSFPDIVWSEPYPPVPFAERGDMFHKVIERQRAINDLASEVVHGTDYDLLYAQKLALLDHLASGTPIPKAALEGLVQLLDTMGDLGEALGRFRYEGIEPPFPMMPDYVQKTCIFAPEPQPKVYILCEEYEGADGIRSFSILRVDQDKNALRQLMQQKIEQDAYGYIAANGVDEDMRDDHFMTNFNNGFVEYYILEEEVQRHAQVRTPDAPELQGNEPSVQPPQLGRAPSLDSVIGSARERMQSKAEQAGRPTPHYEAPEK